MPRWKPKRSGRPLSNYRRFKPYPMTEVDPKTLEDFAASGRAGRRNALADILDSNVTSTSTASLPVDMQKLSCTDAGEKSGSASGGQDGATGSPTDETKPNS